MIHYHFEIMHGDEESFFSLLLQKSSILPSTVVTNMNELILNRTIKEFDI